MNEIVEEGIRQKSQLPEFPYQRGLFLIVSYMFKQCAFNCRMEEVNILSTESMDTPTYAVFQQGAEWADRPWVSKNPSLCIL
jgi:hypothetical protein